MSGPRRFIHRLRSYRRRQFTPVSVDELLDFATRNVPYYREYRGCALDEIPILTKEVIRRCGGQLRSADLDTRQWHYETSGGSTGEPVRFVQDREFLDRTSAAIIEAKRWTGHRPGDRLLKLWGNRQSAAPRHRGWRPLFHHWLANTIVLDTFRLDDNLMDEYIDVLRHWSPRLVVGFASSLVALSERILNHHSPLACVGAVVSTAGTLFPPHRELMRSAFGCAIYDRYGSSEVSIIAAEEQPDQGLRVMPTVYVETLRPDGSHCDSGEIGDIVVTSLANFAMPLIRFRIGDVGACSSRGSSQFLDRLHGRSIEQFRNRRGQLIDGQYFIQAMYFRDWIGQFRIRQIALDQVVIEFVPVADPVASDISDIESNIHVVLGSDVSIDWRPVTEIPPLASGKYLYTVCELQ